MNSSIIFLLIAIALVGVMVFIAISLTSKKRYSFEKEEYQTAWLHIENSFDKNNPRQGPPRNECPRQEHGRTPQKIRRLFFPD